MLSPQANKLSFKIPFFFLAFFLIFSCDKKSNYSKSTSHTQIDSIQLLLNKANQNYIPLSSKKQLLKNLRSKISTTDNNIQKSKYVTQLALILSKTTDSIGFRKTSSEAIALALQTKDSSNLAKAYENLGAFYEKHSIQDSAYFQYAKCEKILKALNEQERLGVLLIKMAIIQSNIGDYTGGEITAIKALEKLKPLDNYVELYRCYNVLADLARLLNEYDRAIGYYDNVLITLKKAELGSLREQSYKNNVGLVYQKKGDHKKAIAHFTQALNFDSLRYKNPRLYGRTLNNLAFSLLKTNNTDQLPDLFHQAIGIQDSINDVLGIAASTYRLAAYHLQQHDTLAAIKNLKKAKTLAIQASENKQLLKVLRMQPKADPVNAAKYTQEYITLNDSLQNQERRIRDKFTRVRFETDEFKAENQLLARQKQLWAGIAAILLLLGFSTFIIVSQRSKNQKLKFKEQQQASNQEIFNLLLAQQEKVEEGKKMEQKRVSEELHDGVLGRMLGARMMLLGLNKKTNPEAIDQRAKAISILQDVEGEVRSISHELSHAAYQKIHNFIRSIEELIQTVKSASNINFNFTFAEHLDWDALNGDIKINLYRMVQENIQNAVKHAECSTIDLSFEGTVESLLITIKDNGKGFIQKKGKKGIGMRNIASRMKKLNGEWNIDSVFNKVLKKFIKRINYV